MNPAITPAQPDPSLLSSSLSHDGFNREQYIEARWTFDDATPLAGGSGIELLSYVDDSSFYFFDVLPQNVIMPAPPKARIHPAMMISISNVAIWKLAPCSVRP